MLKVQPRDLKILSDLSRFGILSSEQIRALHFAGLHHTVLMRRLRMLKSEGFILRIDSLPNNQAAFSLSNDGAKLIRVEPPGRYTNRNTTLHDVTVSGIRVALRELGLGQNFSSEMEMKRKINWRVRERDKSTQIPDGLFTAKMKNLELDQIIAMEVELHAKNHARYRKIVDYYLSRETINYVWYFVKSKGIADTIFKQYVKAKLPGHGPDFIFTTIDDVTVENENFSCWSSKQRDWIKIRDLFVLPERIKNDSRKNDFGLGGVNDSSLGKLAA